MFAGWLFKIAIASVLLLTLSWAAVPANRRNVQAVEVSRIEPIPISLMPDPLGPADQSATQVVSAAPLDSVRLMLGETLSGISVKNLGKYDHDVLDQIRGLNPWVNDQDRIQSGRQIRMPSATAIGADARQEATQSNSALPTEAGKQ